MAVIAKVSPLVTVVPFNLSCFCCMFLLLLLFFLLGSDIGTHVYHEKASGTGIYIVKPSSAFNSNYII